MSGSTMAFDKSGIHSQAGFQYQMKLFLHYLSQLKTGESLAYEYMDDIVASSTVDELSGVLKKGMTLVQAKCKNLSEKQVTRLFVNWVDALRRESNIDSFLVGQGEGYTLHESFHVMEPSEFVHKVRQLSSAHPQSVSAALLKSLSDKEIEDFYSEVKGKSGHMQLDPDDVLADDYQLVLHRYGVSDETYKYRLLEMQGGFEYGILESMKLRRPFVIDFKSAMGIYEDISQRITDSCYEPSFNAWRINSPSVDLEDLASRRDVSQLGYCFDSLSKIANHIYYGEYYSSLRFHKLECCQALQVDDLEGVTYENYEIACDELRGTNHDEPLSRLNRTKSGSNSYCFNEQEKWGSCVYLTRDDAPPERLISWREDENE